MLPYMRLPLALVCASALCAGLAAAQDDTAEVREQPLEAAADVFDRTPVDCVSTTRIDRTEVLDDRTIIFHMRGREAYRNYLPRRCPGLESNDRFSYRVSVPRLCSIDTITVLEQGSRIPGFTCRLGQFHPVSAEDIEELRLVSEGGSTDDGAIRAEPGELPAEPDE